MTKTILKQIINFEHNGDHEKAAQLLNDALPRASLHRTGKIKAGNEDRIKFALDGGEYSAAALCYENGGMVWVSKKTSDGMYRPHDGFSDLGKLYAE